MGALSSQFSNTSLQVLENDNQMPTGFLLRKYLDEHPELLVLLMQEYSKTLGMIEHNRFEAGFLEDDYVHKFFEYYRDTYIDSTYLMDNAIQFTGVKYEEDGWNVVVSLSIQTDDIMFAPHPHWLCCVVRSWIGEEYPTLLRYMNEARKATRLNDTQSYWKDYALVYRDCQTSSITEKELVKIFSRDGFKVIKESQYS